MTVQDLLNVLTRFPGATPVKCSGSITVDGRTIAEKGKMTVAAVKGAKGAVQDITPSPEE